MSGTVPINRREIERPTRQALHLEIIFCALGYLSMRRLYLRVNQYARVRCMPGRRGVYVGRRSLNQLSPDRALKNAIGQAATWLVHASYSVLHCSLVSFQRIILKSLYRDTTTYVIMLSCVCMAVNSTRERSRSIYTSTDD
jgi:hypothetical protein